MSLLLCEVSGDPWPEAAAGRNRASTRLRLLNSRDGHPESRNLILSMEQAKQMVMLIIR